MAGWGKLLYGVGINDADYAVTRYEKVFGKAKMVWSCPIYRSWKNMLMRCYSDKHKHKTPSYASCSVVAEWHKFSAFHEWATSQLWQGNELDKDLLVEGNKVYGPEFCIYITGALNGFLTDRAAGRGQWPLGVSKSQYGNKFLAHCNNPSTGVCEYLGGFLTPEEAHEAWRIKKHEHACNHADLQSDPRVAKALRSRYLRKES